MSCRWADDEDGLWHTACGEIYEFFGGGPGENGFKFCPYCGEPCYPVRYVEPKEAPDEPQEI